MDVVVKRQIDDTTNAVKASGDGETDRGAGRRRVRRTCCVLMIDVARGTVLSSPLMLVARDVWIVNYQVMPATRVPR